eukprot:1770531-Prymnesium_polylepis.3
MGTVVNRGVTSAAGNNVTSGSIIVARRAMANCVEPTTQKVGSCISDRTVRAMPHLPAYAKLGRWRKSGSSSDTVTGCIVNDCTCSSASTSSKAHNASCPSAPSRHASKATDCTFTLGTTSRCTLNSSCLVLNTKTSSDEARHLSLLHHSVAYK